MKTYKFKIHGNKYSVEVGDIEDNVVSVEVNGTPYEVELETEVKRPVRTSVVQVKPAAADARPAGTNAKVDKAAQAVTASGATLKAPLPGVVLDIFVKPGDTVKIGQRVMLLEAMKMENNIDADKDGVIKEVRVHTNDSVLEGDVLIVYE